MRCSQCGYNLDGLAAPSTVVRCPECGDQMPLDEIGRDTRYLPPLESLPVLSRCIRAVVLATLASLALVVAVLITRRLWGSDLVPVTLVTCIIAVACPALTILFAPGVIVGRLAARHAPPHNRAREVARVGAQAMAVSVLAGSFCLMVVCLAAGAALMLALGSS